MSLSFLIAVGVLIVVTQIQRLTSGGDRRASRGPVRTPVRTVAVFGGVVIVGWALLAIAAYAFFSFGGAPRPIAQPVPHPADQHAR